MSGQPTKPRAPMWLVVLAALVVVYIIGNALIATVCNDQQGFSCGG